MLYFYSAIYSNKKILFFIVLFVAQNLISQEYRDNDSLINYTYGQLEKLVYNNKERPTLAKKYADYYLIKSKKEKDSIRIGEAFYLLYNIKNSISNLDSIISFTSNSNHFEYPAKAYSLKGTFLFKLGKNKEALDAYLLAYHYSIKNDNIEQKAQIGYKIGILKNDLGEYKESIKLFKSYYKYLQKSYKNDSLYSRQYIKVLFAIADTYNRLEKHDSASFTINKAFKICEQLNDSLYYPYIILASGSTAYYKKQYITSRDSILKSLPYLKERNDFGNISASYLYLGKGYYDQGLSDQAIIQFKKVDSIFEEKEFVYPEIREAYEIFIDYYKSKNDKDKQLHYLERLFKIDSILDNQYKYLSKKLEKKYNTSELLIEKQNLILDIKKGKKRSTLWILFLSTFLLIIVILTINYYQKQKLLKKKISQYLKKEKENQKLDKIDQKSNSNKNISLPEDLVKEIRKNLKKFEIKNQFLDKNLTQKDVANLIGTNSSYLSKIVNKYEGKNFSVYINDLRIDYAITEIKNNSKIRKYSIKHIAEEVGFSNTESFSKAFYRKTGLYPSVFIKNIDKITV